MRSELVRDPTGVVLAAVDLLCNEVSTLALGSNSFPLIGRLRLAEYLLADVAHWRGVVERHRLVETHLLGEEPELRCSHDQQRAPWPCPDLLAVVDIASVFLGVSCTSKEMVS